MTDPVSPYVQASSQSKRTEQEVREKQISIWDVIRQGALPKPQEPKK